MADRKSNDVERRPRATMVEDAVVHEKIKDGDEALNFLRKEKVGDELEYVDEKALVRKIDWMVMPLMFLCYLLEYLDKSLLNYASVMGILTDADIDTNQYANITLLFYVAFLAFELPHGYLMQRFPTAKYLGTMVTCWGVCVACTAACRSYGSLAAVRFLLGTFESTISPSLIVITTMWYKRHEQSNRIGIWYLGVGTAVIIGSLISFGFQHYESARFASWQIMFLVVGLFTVAIGITVILVLPDNPMSSRLSHAEKVAAIERLRENQTGIENKHFKWKQAIECIRDPQVILQFLIMLSNNVPNGAMSSFQSILISSFGFTSKQTALLQIPSGVIGNTSVLLAAWASAKYNARGVCMIIVVIFCGLLGGGLLAFLPDENQSGKLAGNYLVQATGATQSLGYAYAGANLAVGLALVLFWQPCFLDVEVTRGTVSSPYFQGHTKKVTHNALLLMSFCIGNIIGPLTFRDKDAPGYEPAKITIVAVSVTSAVLISLLILYYVRENHRRDKNPTEHMENVEFADLTDIQNKAFRYKY